MSSQQGKWREEQVLVICPGSQTTMAQLGCSELTPPAHRFPTRMFRDDDTDEWRPYHTFKRKKGGPTATTATATAITTNTTTATNSHAPKDGDGGDEDWEWVEDPDSAEGAVYPIRGLLLRAAAPDSDSNPC